LPAGNQSVARAGDPVLDLHNASYAISNLYRGQGKSRRKWGLQDPLFSLASALGLIMLPTAVAGRHFPFLGRFSSYSYTVHMSSENRQIRAKVPKKVGTQFHPDV
jgi:hypothetical protein